MTKMTKKVALDCALTALTGFEIKEYRVAGTDVVFSADEAIAKIKEMLVALDKKSTGEKTMTENQKQNVGFKEAILCHLMDGKARTATEILNGVEAFPPEMTNQRVSALLRQMILDGKVKKETVKGKAMFSIAEEGE